ncbi:MAG: hypothetical protein R3222_03375 [Balneolaceae bacterium]|nr:hypothetical protein [Balneolaceae bacterium]
MVQEAIHYRDQKEYDLYAYCLMSKHVYLVIRTLIGDEFKIEKTNFPVTVILESLKWYTALKANQILQRRGVFWQAESCDHVIRSGKELKKYYWLCPQ